jgi:hypothetical protein
VGVVTGRSLGARVAALAARTPPWLDDDALAVIVEDVAAEAGLDAGEVMREAERLLRAWSPSPGRSPSLDDVGASVGMTVDEVVAEAERLEARIQRRRAQR